MTSAEVRNCYMKVDGAHPVVERDWPNNPPSQPQVEYLLGLQKERVLPEGYKVKSLDDALHMERSDVSGIINMLKLARKKDSGKAQKTWDMPAGRYALHWEDEGWWFYQIDKPTEGRWKGYTFIKRLIGSPGDYQKMPMRAADRTEALEAINEDPKAALTDYGLQSKVCGVCGSALSNEESLRRGIGPKCAAKMGW